MDDARSLNNVQLIRFEDYGSERTWRRVETFLGLQPAFDITIRSGKPHRALSSGGKNASARRSLIVHGEVKNAFVVYTGYLAPSCTGGWWGELSSSQRASIARYGYECGTDGSCSTATFLSPPPAPQLPPAPTAPPSPSYMLDGFYEPAQGCDEALNAFCAQSCPHDGGGVARRDGSSREDTARCGEVSVSRP